MSSGAIYIGESHSAIDEKGRVLLPAPVRQVASVHDHDTWYLTGGFDKNIFAFPSQMWHTLVAKLQSKSTIDPEFNDFLLFFTGMCGKTKVDTQGRLAIPAPLREYAAVDREAVVLGVADHLQFWNKDSWRAFQGRRASHYREMATRLFGNLLSEAPPAATTGESRHEN